MEVSTAVTISFLVTLVVLVGWIAWGVREYRRTGRATWLWMAALLVLSLLSSLTIYSQLR